jgi:hypothetical protein
MHYSQLQPRAETMCAFGPRDDADREFCWNGNWAAAIDHEDRLAPFIFEDAAPEQKGFENACAAAGFCNLAAPCESRESLSLRLNHCRNPQ